MFVPRWCYIPMGPGLWSLDVDWSITPSGESTMEYFRRRPEVPVKRTFSIFAGLGFSVGQTANCNRVVGNAGCGFVQPNGL